MSDRRTIETGTEYLLGWVQDGVAVLSFNRPERRNALHEEMYRGFAMALPVIAEDPGVGVVVVTGEGGAFCAGGDVKGFAESHARAAGNTAMAPPPAAAIDNLRARQAEVSLALHRMPKLTIAADYQAVRTDLTNLHQSQGAGTGTGPGSGSGNGTTKTHRPVVTHRVSHPRGRGHR